MILYAPFSSEIADWVPCSAGDVTTTVTPARFSPVSASTTRPRIAPVVVDCAAAGGASSAMATPASAAAITRCLAVMLVMALLAITSQW